MEQLNELKKELVIEYIKLYDLYKKLLANANKKAEGKSREDRIENKISKKIELEKLKNRMDVLNKVINSIQTKIDLAKGIEKMNIDSFKFGQIVTPQSLNEAFYQILNQEYQKLDILSTKKVLIEEFSIERRKGINKYDFGPLQILGGLGVMALLGIPFLNITSIPFSITNLLLTMGISYTIGILLVTAITVKLRNQSRNVFIKLNNELKDNALTIENDDTFDEKRILESLIERKIHKLTIIESTQKEYQKLLTTKENTKTIENNKIISIEQKISNEQSNEKKLTRRISNKSN